MRDHSVERMANLRSNFMEFKNPHNAELGSADFFDDFLWHWMTRVVLLSKLKEGILSKEDFPKDWEHLCKSVSRMKALGHFIEVRRGSYIYYTFKPMFWQRMKK